jgi:hypothetical protein
MNVLAPILALLLSVNYTAGFHEGDWVNYLDFRFVTSVTMDQTIVYFGTTSGVLRYDRFANNWLAPLTVTDGMPDQRVDNIAYDPSYDRVYVATPSGNAYYQLTFQQWYITGDFPNNLAHSDLRIPALGMLTTPFGYTYQNGQITDMNFRSYRLTKGQDDGFNHLFAGTWGLGPVIINPRYGEIKLLPFGPYIEDVTALVRVGDNYWFGGGPGEGLEPGASWCDKSLQEWHWYVPRYTGGLASAQITSGLADGKVTWLGTDYGLVRYDMEDDKFASYTSLGLLPSKEVTSLAADSAWIYIGTANGLGFIHKEFDQKGGKHKKSADPPDSLKDTTETKAPLSPKNRLRGWHINCLRMIDGYLYVGTDRGALRRPLDDHGDFEMMNTPDKTLSADIVDIAKSGDSYLFATDDDIVTINSKTGETASLTNRAYFGQWRIRQIIVDSQNIWAATNLGLWKYRIKDGNHRLFNENDGMLSSDIRSIALDGDYIYMATPKGAIRFYWNNPGRVD